MKPGILVMLLAAMLVAMAASLVHARSASAKGVQNDALAAAGRAALLRDIDYDEEHCDGALTVAAWLKVATSFLKPLRHGTCLLRRSFRNAPKHDGSLHS